MTLPVTPTATDLIYCSHQYEGYFAADSENILHTNSELFSVHVQLEGTYVHRFLLLLSHVYARLPQQDVFL